MKHMAVKTDKAPGAIGPYVQAIVDDPFVFASGQIPLDPKTGAFVPGGIAEQTRQVLENLRHVLAAADSSLDKVVKTTVFMTDLGGFAQMNEIYAQFFTNGYPARSTIQVAALPKGALIEIEAIARR